VKLLMDEVDIITWQLTIGRNFKTANSCLSMTTYISFIPKTQRQLLALQDTGFIQTWLINSINILFICTWLKQLMIYQ